MHFNREVSVSVTDFRPYVLFRPTSPTAISLIAIDVTVPWSVSLSTCQVRAFVWNQLPSSFRQPHSVHCPHGSPHPVAYISPHYSHHLRSHHLSLPLPFTPDLNLISFTNPFLHSHCYSFRTAFINLNLY